jgi:hypothetical protein
MTTTPGLAGRAMQTELAEWWTDDGKLPVVALNVVGPRGGLYGYVWVTPGAAEALADRLRVLAKAARLKTLAASADKTAGALGYPPGFGDQP